MRTNVLCYGDNLDILRRYLPETCVDLVSLNPRIATDAQRHRCPPADVRGVP